MHDQRLVCNDCAPCQVFLRSWNSRRTHQSLDEVLRPAPRYSQWTGKSLKIFYSHTYWLMQAIMSRSTGNDELRCFGANRMLRWLNALCIFTNVISYGKNFILSCHTPCRAPVIFETASSYCQVLSAFMTFLCIKQSTRSSELLGRVKVVVERMKLLVSIAREKSKTVEINLQPSLHLRSNKGFLQKKKRNSCCELG